MNSMKVSCTDGDGLIWLWAR